MGRVASKLVAKVGRTGDCNGGFVHCGESSRRERSQGNAECGVQI